MQDCCPRCYVPVATGKRFKVDPFLEVRALVDRTCCLQLSSPSAQETSMSTPDGPLSAFDLIPDDLILEIARQFSHISSAADLVHLHSLDRICRRLHSVLSAAGGPLALAISVHVASGSSDFLRLLATHAAQLTNLESLVVDGPTSLLAFLRALPNPDRLRSLRIDEPCAAADLHVVAERFHGLRTLWVGSLGMQCGCDDADVGRIVAANPDLSSLTLYEVAVDWPALLASPCPSLTELRLERCWSRTAMSRRILDLTGLGACPGAASLRRLEILSCRLARDGGSLASAYALPLLEGLALREPARESPVSPLPLPVRGQLPNLRVVELCPSVCPRWASSLAQSTPAARVAVLAPPPPAPVVSPRAHSPALARMVIAAAASV